jgi:hypothetical protein
MMHKLTNFTLLSLSFFILCSGCTKDPHWKYTTLPGSQKGYESAELLFSSSSDLELQMIRIEKEIYAYLFLTSQKIPSLPENPDKATLLFLVDNVLSLEATLPILLGGQKISLDKKTTTFILETLKAKKALTIKLADYTASLDPEDFEKQFGKFSQDEGILDELLSPLPL